jgi:FtsP/CotA-like multicopper oxidase with cupredoxin domain
MLFRYAVGRWCFPDANLLTTRFSFHRRSFFAAAIKWICFMLYLDKTASRARVREAENARRNRLEIVKALSTGQVTRRELMKWGIFTSAGTLALTNGLSPYAHSQVLPSIPTGTPPSPLFGALPFSQPLMRLNEQKPIDLVPTVAGDETMLAWKDMPDEPYSKRTSWHTEFSMTAGTNAQQLYTNPLTGRGPMEGRPPGEYFAHQRWQEYLPKKGYIMSLGCPDGARLHKDMEVQDENKLWCFTAGKVDGGTLPPPLIKARYGEPVIFRHYNYTSLDEADNGGFGSISQSTHCHNGHNGAASDGANNAHFFPGQFYDYHWSTTLARADLINTDASFNLASGPDGNGGLVNVAGDYRELQSSLWFHDHRFFYTAENVYKGHLGVLNFYSGKDRGSEIIDDKVNLKLPSGRFLDWGNTDFDVNLIFSDAATDQEGQIFFDIFDTEGFLGDLVMVNFQYKPYMDVLPRKYRFRMLCGSMSRWYKLALVNQAGKIVPVQVIANDGNLLPAPVTMSRLDSMASGERFDIIIDFSLFRPGDKLRFVNLLEFEDGRGPKDTLSLGDALKQKSFDPAIGYVMEFRVARFVPSVDNPGYIYDSQRHDDRDLSVVPPKLTDQIPIVTPVRTRVIEFKRGADDPRDNEFGACFPSCPDRESFPWGIRINGEDTHSLNANRVSMLVPRPGEVEHWVLVNGGGGWDHPVHLHFEEGVTISRTNSSFSAMERLARKDVWRLGESGTVTIQVKFGEYGGAYVNHCHNTVHEDAAMLLRYDVLTDPNNPKTSQYHVQVIPTPNPTPDGVTFVMPEILPEGNPFHPSFNPRPRA